MLKVMRCALSEVHQSPPTFTHLVPLVPTPTHVLCAHCVRTHAHLITRTGALYARAGQRNLPSFLYDFNQGIHFFRKISPMVLHI